MKTPLLLAIVLLPLALPAQEEPAAPARTWEEFIARGIVPYRQLTADNFPVNETASEAGFRIQPALEPRYEFRLRSSGGFAFGYVMDWMVFSGLNKNGTYRHRSFKNIKAELPYAQALLDINEIHARRLAAHKEGELPSSRGDSYEQARAELTRKMQEFMDVRFAAARAEMTAFAKETGNGANKKKVRELAAKIKKRLAELPATTVPHGGASLSPSPSVSISPPPAPAVVPSPAPGASP